MQSPAPKKSTRKAKKTGKAILHWFEIVLGIITLIAVVVVTINQILTLGNLDWGSIDTFTLVLKIILQLAIGIEVARMLFSYSLNTLIELAVFIVIRKMLLLEGDFLSLFLGVVSLIVLFAARHFFISDDKVVEEIEGE